MEKKTPSKDVKFKLNIFDQLKDKIVDIAIEYVKKNIDNSKKEFAHYVETQIKSNLERKIKKEIKKYSFKIASLGFLLLGVLFLIYSLLEYVSYIYDLPSFMTNLTFSTLLLICSLIFYLLCE